MPAVCHLATHTRRIFAVALASAIAIAILIMATPAGALAASPDSLSGVYAGAADVSGVGSFAQWRGTAAPVALDYLGDDSWNDISYPNWALDAWKPYVANGGTLVLSVPMLVSSQPGTFAAGAAGDYDQYFKALGQDLVADGEGSTVLRMGWEFNGTWFPWSLSASNPAMSASEYVAYYQHLVTLFRAIPGSNFTFDWTVNPGPSPVSAAQAYPGDAYVNYIGVDVYDSSWGSNGQPISDPAARWNQIANQTDGLNWWSNFAQSHNKPISVPEWGLNTDTSGSNGAGDDPTFIQDMYNWFQANHPAYEMYFNATTSTLGASNDPNASATYSQLWGAAPGSNPSVAVSGSASSSSSAATNNGSTGPTGSSAAASNGSTGSSAAGATAVAPSGAPAATFTALNSSVSATNAAASSKPSVPTTQSPIHHTVKVTITKTHRRRALAHLKTGALKLTSPAKASSHRTTATHRRTVRHTR